jgi:hypothetical protein
MNTIFISYRHSKIFCHIFKEFIGDSYVNEVSRFKLKNLKCKVGLSQSVSSTIGRASHRPHTHEISRNGLNLYCGSSAVTVVAVLASSVLSAAVLRVVI